MWSIQDMLLQSYRTIFLTSQSVLFAVGVFVAAGSRATLALPLAVIGLFLIFPWIGIVNNRGYDVWFFHLRLLRIEKQLPVPDDLFTQFKSWQGKDLKAKQKELSSDELGKLLLKGKTRPILDWWIPIAFCACWVLVAIFVIF